MYCNITQLSVKKKNIKEIKIIFLCTVHFWAALSPFISMGQNMYTILSVLKDSSAQLYNPISRLNPGLGKAAHLDPSHRNTSSWQRTLLDSNGPLTGQQPYSPLRCSRIVVEDLFKEQTEDYYSLLYYTIISENFRTKKMPFSVKKNVLIVGQSHTEVYK